MSNSPKYWFNLKTRKVELGLKSSALDRVGPFETEAEAANAEAILKARAEAWKQEEQNQED